MLTTPVRYHDTSLPYDRPVSRDAKADTSRDAVDALRRSMAVEGDSKARAPSVSNGGDAVKRRKVVLLGSGLVAGPAVRQLASREDVDLVVASNDLPAAEALASPYPNATATLLSTSDAPALAALVASAEVVLSLLPAPFHVQVAEACIAGRTSLVTASYVSTAMSALGEQAKAAGVVLLNELGLDPGIDHASAMRLIEEARAAGHTITSFVSFCGGLPTPEQSHGSLGYKFSWSPRGVLTAALNDARFRLNGEEVKIAGSDLLVRNFPDVPIIDGIDFEGVANRDSVPYLTEYGLEDGLGTVLRGTLRYKGFARVVEVFKRVGLLSLDLLDEPLEAWESLVAICLARSGMAVADDEARSAAILELAGGDAAVAKEVLETMAQLHLIPSSRTPSTPLPALPSTPQAPLDLLSTLLGSLLAYSPGEPDAVFLHHELGTINPAGQPELFTSTLVQYGEPHGASAMATTVGVPIAIGALLILDGALAGHSGLVSPSAPAVWRPLLERLEAGGVRFEESRRVGTRGVLEVLEKGM